MPSGSAHRLHVLPRPGALRRLGSRLAALLRPSAWHRPGHQVLVYLLVPVALDALTVVYLGRINPEFSMLLVRLPGAMMGVCWGWAGFVLCIILGLMLGFPVAGFQSAYLSHRLAEMRRSGNPGPVLPARTELLINLPWFLAAAVGYLVGYAWLFPPVGGALLAGNVLWMRALLYPQHVQIYRYEQARRSPPPAERITARAA